MEASFRTHLNTLIRSSALVIDRPKGVSRPHAPSVVYPLDYGYLQGTSSSDGESIDVWRGSLPEGHLDAVVCTVDVQKRDAEIKLLRRRMLLNMLDIPWHTAYSALQRQPWAAELPSREVSQMRTIR